MENLNYFNENQIKIYFRELPCAIFLIIDSLYNCRLLRVCAYFIRHIECFHSVTLHTTRIFRTPLQSTYVHISVHTYVAKYLGGRKGDNGKDNSYIYIYNNIIIMMIMFLYRLFVYFELCCIQQKHTHRVKHTKFK